MADSIQDFENAEPALLHERLLRWLVVNGMRLSGSSAAGDDATGNGNNAALDLGASVRYVDFYNGGSTTATLSNGGETRHIPAGSGRLCEFTAPSQAFAVVADGDWIATPMQ